MVTLANTFLDLGHLVDFIVLRDTGPYREMLSNRARKIVLYPVSSKGRIKGVIKSFFFMVRYLRRNQDRAIMSTVRELNLFCVGANFLNLGRGKLFIREAATLDRFFDKPSPSDRLIFILMKIFYNRAEGIIANSEETKKDLVEYLGLSPSKIKTIYNPLDLKSIRAEAENSKKTEHPSLVACGRLVPMKNFEDAIRAVVKVREKYPNVILKIIGDGPHYDTLARMIRELQLEGTVELTGFLTAPFSEFACAHVFVQTSLWEGFGYVMPEAMACGTPVVCFDSKGAMREILDKGRFGSLVPTGDITALANEIMRQLETPHPSYLLSEAVGRFDSKGIALQYLDALDVEE
ncbi:glycosyltransferase [Marinobacter sp. ATCH36]|nr:glycosyltransferase [Marinobacter sp. ATCH36]